MRASVTVRVPGSTSNLGAGFDCVGVAVERWLRVTARRPARGPGSPPKEAGNPVTMERRGTLSALQTPPEPLDDYAAVVIAERYLREGRGE